ncbi:MAG: WXG100 family type VII secretion target [Anaerolineales bacterium]|nr:WXG100 family type VII secretion target [Anaerolineales bacterium]
MADIIQVEYESLERLVRRMSTLADQVTRMQKKIQRSYDELHNGGWEGQGASIFFDEMEQEVFPALKRLVAVLQEGASVISEINKIMRDAEREAVRQLTIATVPMSEIERSGVDLTLPEPTPPASDEGSGPHNVEAPTMVDRAFETVLYFGAEAWDDDRPDAARHMRHYLGNSGETLDVDIEKMMRDMPQFEKHSEAYFEEFLNEDIRERILQTYNGQWLQFDIVSEWNDDFYARKSISENWFYAMGGFSYAYSADVTVEPPISPGGNPTVEVNVQMFVHDVYNWDQGKMVTIDKPDVPIIGDYSIPIPDEYQAHIIDEGDRWRVYDTALAQLHTVGLAQEYPIAGRSEIQSLQYEIDLTNQQMTLTDQAPILSEPGR